jgi:hypothetical protein
MFSWRVEMDRFLLFKFSKISLALIFSITFNMFMVAGMAMAQGVIGLRIGIFWLELQFSKAELIWVL